MSTKPKYGEIALGTEFRPTGSRNEISPISINLDETKSRKKLPRWEKWPSFIFYGTVSTVSSVFHGRLTLVISSSLAAKPLHYHHYGLLPPDYYTRTPDAPPTDSEQPLRFNSQEEQRRAPISRYFFPLNGVQIELRSSCRLATHRHKREFASQFPPSNCREGNLDIWTNR